MLGGLKTVHLTDKSVLVSNFLKEIEIPVSTIDHVFRPENSSHQRIAVYFRTPSVFGSKIVFMPPLFKAREVADQLRESAGVLDRPEALESGNAQKLHLARYRNLFWRKKVK